MCFGRLQTRRHVGCFRHPQELHGGIAGGDRNQVSRAASMTFESSTLLAKTATARRYEPR
jgi:hypothetical protein